MRAGEMNERREKPLVTESSAEKEVERHNLPIVRTWHRRPSSSKLVFDRTRCFACTSPGGKPGHWSCANPSCLAHDNFPDRTACFKCKAPRPAVDAASGEPIKPAEPIAESDALGNLGGTEESQRREPDAPHDAAELRQMQGDDAMAERVAVADGGVIAKRKTPAACGSQEMQEDAKERKLNPVSDRGESDEAAVAIITRGEDFSWDGDTHMQIMNRILNLALGCK